jgi:release factor glutamine methyltransferase
VQDEPVTLAHAIGQATARLVSSGVDPASARIDARVLACHAFGLDLAGLILHEPDPPGTEALGRFRDTVSRRMAHEPVAYIVGSREFYGREFRVSPGVLIPRPETELIVELALARVPDRNAAVGIVDVGTGSGCLAVTLACECPRACVVATDISATAIEVARLNASRLDVSDRVVLQRVSLVPRVEEIDIVVSNPPDVPTARRAELPAEVRDFEPGSALFGGEDGLDVVRGLVLEAADVLRRGSGWLIFEFGLGQDEAVRRLLHADPHWTDVTLTNDLQGIPRVACARRA